MAYHAYAFVDGAYLRAVAKRLGSPLVNPHSLLINAVHHDIIQDWCSKPFGKPGVVLARVTYYDGIPDNEADVSDNLKDYWSQVELLEDTDLGFGSVRGGTKKKPKRQKGVDTLIAVDMLVGAFNQLFPIAILAAGDSDFVPVVTEVRRRGAMVAVLAEEGSLADALRRAADRFVPIGNEKGKLSLTPPLFIRGTTFPAE